MWFLEARTMNRLNTMLKDEQANRRRFPRHYTDFSFEIAGQRFQGNELSLGGLSFQVPAHKFQFMKDQVFHYLHLYLPQSIKPCASIKQTIVRRLKSEFGVWTFAFEFEQIESLQAAKVQQILDGRMQQSIEREFTSISTESLTSHNQDELTKLEIEAAWIERLYELTQDKTIDDAKLRAFTKKFCEKLGAKSQLCIH